MVRSCSVPGCKTRLTKGTKFHKFPKDPELRKQWVKAIGGTNLSSSETVVICSIHFAKDDYTINSYGHTVLKQNVLPSKFNVTTKEVVETPNEIITEQIKEEIITASNSDDEATVTAYNSNDEGTISAYDSNDEGTVSSCEMNEITFDEKSTIVIYQDGNDMEDGEKIEFLNVNCEKEGITEVDGNLQGAVHTHMASFRPKRQYRYIGDIKNVDFTSPDEARRCIEMAIGCVDNQKYKIKRLREQVKNANRFVFKSEFEIQRILEKKIMEEEQA